MDEEREQRRKWLAACLRALATAPEEPEEPEEEEVGDE